MRAIHGKAKTASGSEENQSDTEAQQQPPQEEDDEDTPVEDAKDNNQQQDQQTDKDNDGHAETLEASDSSSEIVTDPLLTSRLRYCFCTRTGES